MFDSGIYSILGTGDERGTFGDVGLKLGVSSIQQCLLIGRDLGKRQNVLDTLLAKLNIQGKVVQTVLGLEGGRALLISIEVDI